METLETPALESAPVTPAERITAIDTLRGFALLGILLMNIIGFSMYLSAYDNPTVTGGATGANLAVWAVLHVLAEGKMRCLFSLVFGASVILLTSRLEKTGEAADIYYRRTIWLGLFGIAHAYLLWLGDILYPYALCGLLLYPFRKMAPKGLLTLGTILLLMTAASYMQDAFSQKETIEKARAARAVAASGQKLTEEQQDQKTEYERQEKRRLPDAAALQKEAAKWRGSVLDVIEVRAGIVREFHSGRYYSYHNWDIWSMMLIGMGLMKLGVLAGRSSIRTYVWMAIAGYAIGLPVNIYTAYIIIRGNFDPVLQTFSAVTYDVGRLSIALGHLGIIMLLCKTKTMQWLTNSLGAVGQMAFSNYIMHSIVCAFIFTGYGFAMYGRLQRYQVYYVVAAIWIFQMIVSPIWLRHFRFGPLEWGWRSLTYWKKQPMRLPKPADPADEIAGAASA